MKALRWFFLFAMVICLLVPKAEAISIDFRHPFFQPGLGESYSLSRTVDSINLTITALPEGALLYWDNTDGFGVRFDYENDEIEGSEFLRVGFSDTVYLSGFFVTDLFYSDHNRGYNEYGWYSINGDPEVKFVAHTSQTPGTNGELFVGVGANVDYILFSAPGLLSCWQDHEFSLGGVDVAAVPEPATLFLLGSGLIGLGVFRRKLRKS